MVVLDVVFSLLHYKTNKENTTPNKLTNKHTKIKTHETKQTETRKKKTNKQKQKQKQQTTTKNNNNKQNKTKSSNHPYNYISQCCQ